MKVEILLMFGLLMGASGARAMCVAVAYDLLTWNEKGDAALVRQISSGPEGGGTENFIILNFASAPQVFEVSSNMSPGDGSTPQSVTKKKCQEQVEKANAVLAKENFKDRLIDACGEDRSGIFPRGSGKKFDLDLNKAQAMTKKIKLKDPEIASKEGVHFVVIDQTMDCRSQALQRWVFDQATKSYRKIP